MLGSAGELSSGLITPGTYRLQSSKSNINATSEHAPHQVENREHKEWNFTTFNTTDIFSDMYLYDNLTVHSQNAASSLFIVRGGAGQRRVRDVRYLSLGFLPVSILIFTGLTAISGN